jgi:hypothetical protein
MNWPMQRPLARTSGVVLVVVKQPIESMAAIRYANVKRLCTW